MQILLGCEEAGLISIHYDHGTVPEIMVTGDMSDRICKKEIKIGNVTIQVFERTAI